MGKGIPSNNVIVYEISVSFDLNAKFTYKKTQMHFPFFVFQEIIKELGIIDNDEF